MKNDGLFEAISNKMDGSKFVKFPDVDILFGRLPDITLKSLRDEVYKIRDGFASSKRYNHRLAGHIEREFDLSHCKSLVNDFILEHVEWYDTTYNITPIFLTKSCRYKIDSLWVNFQKKHEFNPPHNHTGIVSFVIWIDIPYDLDEEEAQFPEGSARQTSRFGLIASNRGGKMSVDTIPVDKSYEGVVCFFPSWMIHYVNPFYTSDDYRISISGNIFLDVEQTI